MENSLQSGKLRGTKEPPRRVTVRGRGNGGKSDASREYLMGYSDPAAQREYQRKWYADRREKYLAGMVCVDCGAAEHLEIDHRDPALKVAHNIWSWRHDRILHELAKCDVRCSACHQARHGADRMRHGIGRYKAGCRCETCRAAKREEGQRYSRPSRARKDAA